MEENTVFIALIAINASLITLVITFVIAISSYYKTRINDAEFEADQLIQDFIDNCSSEDFFPQKAREVKIDNKNYNSIESALKILLHPIYFSEIKEKISQNKYTCLHEVFFNYPYTWPENSVDSDIESDTKKTIMISLYNDITVELKNKFKRKPFFGRNESKTIISQIKKNPNEITERLLEIDNFQKKYLEEKEDISRNNYSLAFDYLNRVKKNNSNLHQENNKNSEIQRTIKNINRHIIKDIKPALNKLNLINHLKSEAIGSNRLSKICYFLLYQFLFGVILPLIFINYLPLNLNTLIGKCWGHDTSTLMSNILIFLSLMPYLILIKILPKEILLNSDNKCDTANQV